MSRILVIEDDLNTRNLYQDILTKAGFEVVTAVDGEEGLNKIREGGYNLILLDVMLPKMDGIAILRQLTAKGPNQKNGQIVLLTNLSEEPVFKEANELGVSNIILKISLNPDQLVEKVRELAS